MILAFDRCHPRFDLDKAPEQPELALYSSRRPGNAWPVGGRSLRLLTRLLEKWKILYPRSALVSLSISLFTHPLFGWWRRPNWRNFLPISNSSLCKNSERRPVIRLDNLHFPVSNFKKLKYFFLFWKWRFKLCDQKNCYEIQQKFCKVYQTYKL